MGVMDFAGGIVVHTTAGVSALVIAIALGKRDGFPQHALPPHAPWMVMVGAGMLWVGWFGFNAGTRSPQARTPEWPCSSPIWPRRSRR